MCGMISVSSGLFLKVDWKVTNGLGWRAFWHCYRHTQCAPCSCNYDVRGGGGVEEKAALHHPVQSYRPGLLVCLLMVARLLEPLLHWIGHVHRFSGNRF